MKKAFFAFLLFVVAIPTQAQNSLLWKIESPQGKVSYLYGTYHLLGADYFKERPAVMEAYKASQKVVVETVIDSSKLMEFASLMMMPGYSLKEMTDSADYQLLKKELEPILGMDLMMFDIMKPMVLSTSYSVALAEKLTPDSLIYGGLPMDMYFARNAKLEGKELIKLETMKEQFEILFGNQTVEEQLADLLDIVKEDQKGSDVMMGILNAYFDNDLDGLYASSMEFDGESESMEVMIDDRNKNWIVSLEEPLQEGGLFIAVGALHLPGEKGLIKLLQAKGFKFTALN